MHLWQIRHIPNLRQTLLKFTFVTAACVAAAITLLPTTRFVAGQTAEATKEPAIGGTKAAQASEFFEKVRQELPKHQSIKAELTQLVSIGDQQFKIGGEYLSSGAKLLLNYSMTPDQGAKCEMVEVCDGKELWTLLSLPDSKRVTHRNVQQILAAAVVANKNKVPEATVNLELGMGGLVALLASLERTMVFEGMKEEGSGGHSRMIIQGRWKPEFAQRFPKDKGDALPAYIPDLVRIFVNTQTLFPEKILYVKKQPQKKQFRALVSLEFRNVEFDLPVDEKAFVFVIPEGTVPEDVTKFYLDRLAVPESQPPAAN